MSFSSRLRIARERIGLSQIELSKKIERSKSVVSNYENGSSKPNVDDLVKLSAILEVDPNYLLFDELSDTVQKLVESELGNCAFDGLNTEGTAKVKAYIEDLKGNPNYTAEHGIGEEVAADIGKIAALSRARTDTS